jgi:L-aminopeptidase/D-esterase-like protein
MTRTSLSVSGVAAAAVIAAAMARVPVVPAGGDIGLPPPGQAPPRDGPAESSPADVHVRGLTAVQGIRVGQHTLGERPTGCTVVLAPEGTIGSVDVRGGAPGTRETDLLDPVNSVEIVNAIVLSGGSAYGLDAAQGVVRFLEERGIGYRVGTGVVPIVPAAILFDLGFGGNPRIRPTADCGYQAAQSAHNGAVAEGNVGAGTGATVGKTRPGRSMKGGIGSASIALPNGVIVAALAAVNAVGDIIDPATGQVIAGVRSEDGKSLADARTLLRSGALLNRPASRPGENTTLGVVATNAKLTKAQARKVAEMAHDGYARAISPAHTPGDGDTIFSLATGAWSGDVNLAVIGALAAEAMADAIVRAVTETESLGGVPSARELGTVPARLKRADRR